MLPQNLKPSARKPWCVIKTVRRYKAMEDPSNEANLALDIAAGYRFFWTKRRQEPPQVSSNTLEDETDFVKWYLRSFLVQSIEDGNMEVKEEPYKPQRETLDENDKG